VKGVNIRSRQALLVKAPARKVFSTPVDSVTMTFNPITGDEAHHDGLK